MAAGFPKLVESHWMRRYCSWRSIMIRPPKLIIRRQGSQAPVTTREICALVSSARRQSPPDSDSPVFQPSSGTPKFYYRSSLPSRSNSGDDALVCRHDLATPQENFKWRWSCVHKDGQPFSHCWSGRAWIGRTQIRHGGNSIKDHASTVICV